MASETIDPIDWPIPPTYMHDSLACHARQVTGSNARHKSKVSRSIIESGTYITQSKRTAYAVTQGIIN